MAPPSFTKERPAEKAIVFYAEDGGSWPHFEPIIRELTGPMERTIWYITSSGTDPILRRRDPRIRVLRTDEGFRRAYLFQTMKVGVLVATVPQLGIKVLPRSRFADELGTRYVYVFHSMASTHMIYEPDGFDNYDTVCCCGPYMVDEIRAREKAAGLKAKELFPHGYGRLDAILATGARRARHPRPTNDPPVVLVAPSWGPTCIFETCGDALVGALLDAGYEVIARPHPMTIKKSPDAVPSLVNRFGSHARFTLDTGMAAQASLHRSDLMVSDWSGAALEYAFGLERPVLFVDVARKVNNPEYANLGLEPFEASVRARIGRIVAPDRLPDAPGMVRDLLADAAGFTEQIRAARAEHIFNVGSSGHAAAELIAAKADAFATSQKGNA